MDGLTIRRRRMPMPVGTAAILAVWALAGCGSTPPPMHIESVPEPGTALTRQAVEARILARTDALETYMSDVAGRLVIQGVPPEKPKPMTPAAQKLKESARREYPGEWSTVLSTTRLLAKRSPGEEFRTRFVAEFGTRQTAFSLLAVGDRFWVRPPQPNASIVTGVFDVMRTRPADWPTLRPQDLGVLLFMDDLRRRGGEAAYVTTMETWPDYYILHVIYPERSPEILYSRIWVDRRTLAVAYHQIFDADGTVVAEARLTEYRDFPANPKSKGTTLHSPTPGAGATVTLPMNVVVFWPKENMALQLQFSHVVLNEPMQNQYFAPPDAAKARIVEMPSPGAPESPQRN